MNESNEISNQPELQVVGYCDSDGFLNKHCHGDYSEPVCLVAVAEEIIAQRDARIEELKLILKQEEDVSVETCKMFRDRIKFLESELAALKSSGGAVAQKVWPEGDYGPSIEELGLLPIPVGAKLYMTPQQPREPIKCQTCKDSGVVSTTDKDHNGDHIEKRCPVCAGGVDERAAFEVEPEGWWNEDRNVFTWPIQMGEWGARIECHAHSPAEAKALAQQITRAALNAGSAVPDGDVYRRAVERIAGIGSDSLHFHPSHMSRIAREAMKAAAPTAKKEG